MRKIIILLIVVGLVSAVATILKPWDQTFSRINLGRTAQTGSVLKGSLATTQSPETHTAAKIAPKDLLKLPNEIVTHIQSRITQSNITTLGADGEVLAQQLTAVRKQIEDQLRTVKATYNIPKTVKLNQSTEIALIIDGTNSADITKSISMFPGKPEDIDVKVSNEVSARLTGPSSDVTVSLRGGDEKKSITPAAPTTWIWDVIPKQRGTIVLTLEVYAWVTIAGAAKPVEFNTARWQIPVEATYWEITKEYVAEIDPIWKTISAIGAGLAAFLTWVGITSIKKKPGRKK